MNSETRYARSGKVNIAYRVTGEGPIDLVLVSGWVSHLELAWEEPEHGSFLRRLASFSRLISFDKRGTGLSDRVPDNELPTLEVRMDDLRAVMDAAGSQSAALFGFSEGGNMAMLFAATYPERTVALVTFGCFAKRIWSADYPWAPTPEARQRDYELVEREWGGLMDLSRYVPSRMKDAEFTRRLATYFRRSASPSAAVALLRMNTQIDVRDVLPAIKVPTLVLHRRGDLDINIEEGRWLAARIPGARFVELSGDDHLPWVGDQDSVLDEIEEFLTGVRSARDVDRVLATILVTDICDSTRHASEMGDRRWRELLERHNDVSRNAVLRYRGRSIKSTGDGVLATFDGPARAIRSALAIRDEVGRMGLSIRAGLHAGEIELVGQDITGIAVHAATRVAARAGAGEVWTSRTVRDLVAGSGLMFTEQGEFELKGIPGNWPLFTVE